MIVRVALTGKAHTLLLDLAKQHQLSPARMLRSVVEVGVIGAKEGTLKSTAAFVSPLLLRYAPTPPKKIRLVLSPETYNYIDKYTEAHSLSFTRFSELSLLHYVNLLEQRSHQYDKHFTDSKRSNPDTNYRGDERAGDQVKIFTSYLRTGRISPQIAEFLADLGHPPARLSLGIDTIIEGVGAISKRWLLQDRIDCLESRDYRTSTHIANELNLKISALQALVAMVERLPRISSGDVLTRTGYRMSSAFFTQALALAKEFISFLQNSENDVQDQLNQFRERFEQVLVDLEGIRPRDPWSDTDTSLGYLCGLIDMCSHFVDPVLGSVPLQSPFSTFYLASGETLLQPRFSLWDFWKRFSLISRRSSPSFHGRVNLRETLRLTWINLILGAYLR